MLLAEMNAAIAGHEDWKAAGRPGGTIPHEHAVGELAALAGDATALLDHRLSAAEVTVSRVGLRPYTIDHLPLIGPADDARVLLATATYRCGVLLAPRIAALIGDEVTAPGPWTATRTGRCGRCRPPTRTPSRTARQPT